MKSGFNVRNIKIQTKSTAIFFKEENIDSHQRIIYRIVSQIASTPHSQLSTFFEPPIFPLMNSELLYFYCKICRRLSYVNISTITGQELICKSCSKSRSLWQPDRNSFLSSSPISNFRSDSYEHLVNSLVRSSVSLGLKHTCKIFFSQI